MTEFREYPWTLRDDEWPWMTTLHAADQVVGACVSLEQELTLVLAAVPDYDMAKAQGRCVKVTLVPLGQAMPRGEWKFVCMVRVRLPGKTGTYPSALFYRPVSETPVSLELPPLREEPPLASAVASASSALASSANTSSARAQSQAPSRASAASPAPLRRSSPGVPTAPSVRSTVPPSPPASVGK